MNTYAHTLYTCILHFVDFCYVFFDEGQTGNQHNSILNKAVRLKPIVIFFIKLGQFICICFWTALFPVLQ